MKIIWKGNWKQGEITVETETVSEMVKILSELRDEGGELGAIEEKQTLAIPSIDMPRIAGNIGCAEALREVLRSSWGKIEPRTMAEIMDVFQASAIYFGRGTISGLLSAMTKKGELRRVQKGDLWGYIING